jgi:type IV pilus biogenesis protein CpaD/CtpE
MLSRTVLAALSLMALSACAQNQPAPATAPAPTAPSGYSRDTPVERIAADPAAAAILNKDLPGLLSDAQYPLFKSMSLKQLQAASGGELREADVDKAATDLQALFPH